MATHRASAPALGALIAVPLVLVLAACTSTAGSSSAPERVDGSGAAASTSIAPTVAPADPSSAVASSTPPPRRRTVGAAPAAPTTTIASATSSVAPEATTPTAVPASGVAANGFPVIAYFEATKRICDDHADGFGNPRADPARFVNATIVEQLDEFRTVIVDGLGTRLVIDIRGEPPTVALEDDTVPLPFDLSFGCPSNLYVGTAAD